MTNSVQYCRYLSVAYWCVGIACPRNRSQIIVLRFPEYPSVSTRDHPGQTLTYRKMPR
jgi:hypothetical protein